MRTTLNTILAFIGLLANNETTFAIVVTLLLVINLIPLFVPTDENN